MSIFTKKPTKTINHKTFFQGKKKTVKVYSFLPKSHKESSSFGFQWNRYKKIQIDSMNGTDVTERHLKQMMDKPLSSLKGKTVLEIGAGAGRYTDILKDYAKQVIIVDPSDAVFANVALGAPNVTAVQADLFEIPVKATGIDIVFCRGVVQHTRDPRLALRTILNYVKPKGEVLFDVYPKNWRTIFYTKYYLRPFTKRMDKKKFALLLEKYMPPVLAFKAKFFNKLFPDIRYIRDIPDILIPIADYTRRLPGMSWSQYKEWAILDTFDMYTPEYDTPLTFKDILKQVTNENTQIVKADEDQYQFRVKRIK